MAPRSSHWLLLAALVACGDNTASPPDARVTPDAATTPVLRNPVDLPDSELADEALAIIGAPVPGAAAACQACHGLTRSRLRAWSDATRYAAMHCFDDLAVASPESARAMLDCIRRNPADPDSDFVAAYAGVFTAAARLPWFAHTFRVAYGDAAEAKLASFLATVAMPRSVAIAPQLTQAQFDLVAEYFVRGAPLLTEKVPDGGAPTECTPALDAALPAHVADLATTGWRRRNADAMLGMYGCPPGESGLGCLQNEVAANSTAFGATWDVAGLGALRVLQSYGEGFQSAYWTRGSADGRFLAHGVWDLVGSHIIDLQRGLAVAINTDFDPAFFPDNSGFIFQGDGRNTCPQTVLTDLSGNAATINTTTEPRCSNLTSVGNYQHVGRPLGGSDYFAISGYYVSDDGGHERTYGDPGAEFGEASQETFTPLTFDGTRFVQRPSVVVEQPYEGDSVLSPSATLMVNRLEGPTSAQLGFVVRRVDAVATDAGYTITTPALATICATGGKPAFSFDERWLVYHHYLDPSSDADAQELGFTGRTDPLFAEYADKGAANSYLIDLTTGVRTRITNMAPGQYALFPHFRSDGWIYLQVRDPLRGAGTEYTVASPAALILETP